MLDITKSLVVWRSIKSPVSWDLYRVMRLPKALNIFQSDPLTIILPPKISPPREFEIPPTPKEKILSCLICFPHSTPEEVSRLVLLSPFLVTVLLNKMHRSSIVTCANDEGKRYTYRPSKKPSRTKKRLVAIKLV